MELHVTQLFSSNVSASLAGHRHTHELLDLLAVSSASRGYNLFRDGFAGYVASAPRGTRKDQGARTGAQ